MPRMTYPWLSIFLTVKARIAQSQLAGVKDVLRIQRALDRAQHVEGAAQRFLHVRSAQQAHPVMVAERGIIFNQHGIGRIPGRAIPLRAPLHLALAAQ
ncbi:hypothetical protein G6F60_015579 [Rhizopus arrhizus]|nr:hypothetical protein G6F60_015579 [Rhizopus arrhizus]